MVECWKNSIIFAKIIISNLFNINNMFSTHFRIHLKNKSVIFIELFNLTFGDSYF